jgi:DNA-binding CsgD family transcriptional regulator
LPLSIRPFTGRQREIAHLIATIVVENGQRRGLSYAEIGRELGLSEHTVRSYVREMANLIDGLDMFPPRTRIWIITKYPDIAESIRQEVAEI